MTPTGRCISGLSGDDFANITGGKMPSFAYNSAGHVVLRDDKTIDHHNHNINVVNYVSPGGEVTQHTQMKFGADLQQPPGTAA